MRTRVSLDAICVPSEDVAVRQLDGDIIIIPLVAGITPSEGEVLTFNDTGRAILRKLNGRRTLREVASLLSADFDARTADLERDVLRFAGALCRRGVLVIRGGSVPPRTQ